MLETKKILLLGTGGHCNSVLDSLLTTAQYNTIGIVSKEENNTRNNHSSVMGIPIVGDDSNLVQLYSKGYTDAFIAIGSIGDVTLRKRLYELVKKIGFHVPNIIDKTSIISDYAKLGEGIYIGKNVVINANTNIGDCAIVNTSSVIEHECYIGDFVHIAPGTILGGNVRVGSCAHIGMGSLLKQGINIGSNTMIGMGSVVLRDIEENVVAYGNPCREENHE